MSWLVLHFEKKKIWISLCKDLVNAFNGLHEIVIRFSQIYDMLKNKNKKGKEKRKS